MVGRPLVLEQAQVRGASHQYALKRAESVWQKRILGYDSYPKREFTLRKLRGFGAANADSSGERPHDIGDGPNQRRLAGAVGTDKAKQLACG